MTWVAHKGVEIAGEYYTPGQIIADIPAEAVAWLLECRAIEEVETADKPAAKKKGGK
jgi:hypothetical protein